MGITAFETWRIKSRALERNPTPGGATWQKDRCIRCNVLIDANECFQIEMSIDGELFTEGTVCAPDRSLGDFSIGDKCLAVVEERASDQGTPFGMVELKSVGCWLDRRHRLVYQKNEYGIVVLSNPQDIDAFELKWLFRLSAEDLKIISLVPRPRETFR